MTEDDDLALEDWDNEAPLTEHNLPYSVRKSLRAHDALADVDTGDCWPYC
jgi:hypothetical protein